MLEPANMSVHAETQLLRPFSNFTLDNKDLLKIHEERSLTLFPRFGLRWQNMEHFAEFGIQAGKLDSHASAGLESSPP
jgi:hypothetical protein